MRRTRSAGTDSPAPVRPRTLAGFRDPVPARRRPACCSGARSHRFTYSTTHGASVCVLHRLDHEVPWHAVEELLDVQIDHPVASSSSVPGRPPPRPAPTGPADSPYESGWKIGSTFRSSLRGYHRLGDPVRDGRHPENPGARAMRFRDLHRPHRRREVATPTTSDSRSCTDCLFRSFSNSSIDLPVHPGAPLFALTFSHASHTSHFEISNDLPDDFSSSTRLLPDHARLIERTTATNDPAPSLHPHYRSFTTTTSRSASAPRDGTQPLTVSAAPGRSLSPPPT